MDKCYHTNAVAQLDFCLLIPCYNNAEGLKRSLKSVHYAEERCMVVVVDDGSKIPLALKELQTATAAPVHLICLSQNNGITAALNAGLEWITTHVAVKYIARLDCNDTCEASRFQEQVAFLDANPRVGLLGAWCRFKNHTSGASYLFKAPFGDNAIRKAMHAGNVFIHPTVMFRAEAAKAVGFYPDKFPHAEDYAFFWALLKVCEGAVLQKRLVICAMNPAGISLQNRKVQLESCRKIISLFGTQPLWQKWGICKTWLRQMAPETLIFWWKRRK